MRKAGLLSTTFSIRKKDFHKGQGYNLVDLGCKHLMLWVGFRRSTLCYGWGLGGKKENLKLLSSLHREQRAHSLTFG